MYKLREERNIKPCTFGHLVSSMLYEKRFGPYFTAPVIAGLEEDGTPYLCGMDTIGAMETAKDFIVQVRAPARAVWAPGGARADRAWAHAQIVHAEPHARAAHCGTPPQQGTAPESLYGMCESMWRPDMDADELFEALAQCLLSGVDRDALAGWGALVHVITPQSVTSRTLKGRMD